MREWALLPWFRERGEHLISPDDLAAAVKLLPYGKVFRVAGRDGDFVVLNYGATSIRAAAAAITPITADVRAPGTSVVLMNDKPAEVLEVHLHHERREPMYVLRVGGKKRTKRYWNSDFAP